ncbi:MAG: ester cyclase [Actinomycetota bacterium]
MKGFDPKFRDLPDYIIGITKEIWEDRGIATLHDYYAPDIVVRSPASVVVGNQGVIAATMATLAEFPDRQLLGEDVIWSGDDERGFLSSHRIYSTATHAGDGVYGAATGTKLRYRIIADCAAKDNQIYDEWLIRDQGAIVRQLGLDPRRYAADLIEAEGGPEACVRPFTPAIDQPGGYDGTGNDGEPGRRYAATLEAIMGADLAAVERDYDRACQLELPGGVTGHGWADADEFWLGLRAAFPDATFTVHHRIGRTDDASAPRAALRWSLDGIHSGWGAFGTPTDAPVHVMGLSHAEYGPWGLRREFVVFDETAVWKQILLHTG